MVGGLANGASTASMACGTGLVFQLAKLVPDITPMSGGGGACVNTRVARPLPRQLQPPPQESSPAGFATTGSVLVAIIFKLTDGSAPTRLRLIAPGSM